MRKVVACSIGLMLLFAVANCANWAVLVAGSNGYSNYRHQADICHVYQTLVKGGIPAANIVVFAYDDIAHNTQNPVKGKIFNKPNGPDVYEGCQIDYKGKDVTPKNFLSVLKQDSAAMQKIGTGRVLKSTSADKVFINFADHGAPGLIAFPSQYLYATDLTPVLNGMWKNQQYQELVFYLEACESGSMFEGFPANQKLYAVTAANPTESSWAAYCPPDAHAGGHNIGSCLGDLFSVNWMEDTDASNTSTESLQAQYTKVMRETAAKSHVMQYGDQSFVSETINNFVGNQNGPKSDITESRGSLTSSRDAHLIYLQHKHSTLLTPESEAELKAELASRKFYDSLFASIKSIVGTLPTATTTDFDCYKEMIDSLEKNCGQKTSDYGLKYFRTLFDICAYDSVDLSAVKRQLLQVCLSKSAPSVLVQA